MYMHKTGYGFFIIILLLWNAGCGEGSVSPIEVEITPETLEQIESLHGGAIKTMEVSEDGVFFVISGNDLYRSDDEAQSWQRVTDDATGMTGILTARDEYLFLFGPDGLKRSAFGGDSMSRIHFPEQRIRDMHNIGDDSLLAGTNNGLYYSDYLGDTWQFIGFENRNVNYIAGNYDGEMAISSEGEIFKSTGATDSWETTGVELSQLSMLTYLPDGSLAVSTSSRNEHRFFRLSQDNELVPLPIPGDNQRVVITTVVEDQDGTLYAGSRGSCIESCREPGGVFRFDAAANEWVEAGLQKAAISNLHITNQGSLFAATDYLISDVLGETHLAYGMARSDDGGDSWNFINNGITNSEVYAFGSSKDGTLYAAADYFAHQSDDDGRTWNKIFKLPRFSVASRNLTHRVAGSGSGHFFFNQSAFLHVGSENTLQPVETIQFDSHGSALRTLVVMDNGDFIAVKNGNIVRSVDAGQSFDILYEPQGENHIFMIAQNPQGQLFAIKSGLTGLLISDDEGESWSFDFEIEGVDASVNMMHAPSPQFIAMSGRNDLVLLDRSSGNWEVYHENIPSNLGNSIFSTDVYDVAARARNAIYIATSTGLFRSTDQGESWNQIGNVNDRFNAVHLTNSEEIIAGSTQNGAFRVVNN